MASYDIIGNIAVIKTEGKTKNQKYELARQLLERPSIKTVLEKVGKVQGRLRKIKTKYLIGEKNFIAVYKENDCLFKLNIETCYFSPRLSNERKEIASYVRKKDEVLVMFSGVGSYPIVIYKLSNPKKITAIEISKECNKYFKENLRLNKIHSEKIELIQGDVKKKLSSKKFDVVIMPRPNLKDTFFKYGLKAAKKGTKIITYGFCKENEKENFVEKLKKEAGKLKRKIQIKKIKKAGEIAPYKFRYRIEINVLN